MNNRHLRAFAIGALLSTSVFGSAYYFLEEPKEVKDLDEKQLVAAVEDLGYVVDKKETTNEQAEKTKEETNNEQTEKAEEEKTPEAKTPAKETTPTAEKPATPAVVEYKLQILSGMATSEIATILKDAKVVDDATKFEQYLISTGYHTEVQIGEFVVKSDMTYEQIAKIITKS